MLENKEILINGILNLYSITHNIFSEDYFLRRRMTRKEKDFLIKRNINVDTPLEFVKSNVERYVNNFYSELIVDDKLFDKYNSEQKVRLNNLNDLIKASKQNTINTIIDTYSRILNEGNGYIESYLKFEQKLSEMVSDLETDINSISGQIENCMLLWDYGNKGKVRYRLIANADSCKECKEHNGKELLTDDFKENEFFPFIHPNCRCQIEVLDQNGNIIAVINPQPKKPSESAANIYQIVLDAISNALTAAALIPGADTFVDIAAIPVDLLRGDFISAGLDAVGAIPFVGEAADTAKLAKVADNAIDAAKVADKAADAVKVVNKVSSVSDNVKSVAKKYNLGNNGLFGEKGKNSRIFKSNDPVKSSADFYKKISKGGVEKPLPNGKGVQTVFEDKSSVVYRVITKTPNSPAIEITVKTSGKIKSQKIHFIKE